jgi:hypothetical protein
MQEEDDFGSESEFSIDLDAKPTSFEKKSNRGRPATKKPHASHCKLRVCSGMKAIIVAQYGAQFFLRQQGTKNYAKDHEQMYYEVGGALALVKDEKPKENKIRADVNDSVLYFDLNHCNANNAATNVSLIDKLATTKPSVVILDYTSSTSVEIKEAATKCFAFKEVQLVIMVNSGLKNEQGGADRNPYGEVRVMARDRKTRDMIFTQMKLGLAEKDKLSPQAHEMARSAKSAGLAVSFLGLFRTKKKRFQPIEEHDLAQDNRAVIGAQA